MGLRSLQPDLGRAKASRRHAIGPQHPSLVYGGDSGHSWLFGGLAAGGPSAETWSYDIERGVWARLEAADGPSARSSQSASRNTQTGGILMFGGLTADGPSSELWEWNS